MQQAYDQLPADAEWSCSFGNPGERNFEERYRRPDGTLWIISNGFYGDEWKCERG
jgi:hypothetical protein